MSKQEGFWRQQARDDTDLPWPFPHRWKREENRQAIIHRLKLIQAKARESMYKGSSLCRLCGHLNGASEFSYRGWVWPLGLLHYIEEHKVCPSKEFRRLLRKG